MGIIEREQLSKSDAGGFKGIYTLCLDAES